MGKRLWEIGYFFRFSVIFRLILDLSQKSEYGLLQRPGVTGHTYRYAFYWKAPIIRESLYFMKKIEYQIKSTKPNVKVRCHGDLLLVLETVERACILWRRSSIKLSQRSQMWRFAVMATYYLYSKQFHANRLVHSDRSATCNCKSHNSVFRFMRCRILLAWV